MAKKTTVLTSANLKKVATEFNKLFEWEGTDDAIDVKKATDEEMRSAIIEGAALLDEKDEVSPTCKKVLDSLKSGEKKKEATTTEKKGKAKETKGKTAKGKEAKPKAEKPKAKKKELSCYGHQMSSQGAAIDNIVKDGKGHKLEKIAEKVGVTTSRVLGHLKHLKSDKGCEVVLDEKKGSYTVTGGGQ